jgi:uncharacterized protein YegJ (DUF2314 family)
MKSSALKSLGYALLIGGMIAGAISPSAAQSLTDKAERDELAIVSSKDPVMAAAMRKARASLSEFLTTAANPTPAMRGFAVKVAVREGRNAEYFWIHPFERKGERFSGRLNNTPRSVRSVKAGQTITFSEIEIVDWTYMDGSAMKGNYTACALLAAAPRQERETFFKKFGLDCGA